MDQLLKNFSQDRQIIFNGDTQEARDSLGTTSEVRLSNLVKSADVIAVDEAQRIPNIALALKIIVDQFPNKKLFVTGSTSLELARGIPEVKLISKENYLNFVGG